jgi:hypothetical protein
LALKRFSLAGRQRRLPVLVGMTQSGLNLVDDGFKPLLGIFNLIHVVEWLSVWLRHHNLAC